MTICATSTAKGGAIGIIRVSGPQSIAFTDAIFSGRKSLTQVHPYTLNFGRIMDGEEVVDEVLVSVFHAPNSYTGEESTEISCHGSSFILQRVIELLLQQGCRMAEPGEFTKRAFFNGKMDLSQAEAVADLIASTNAASHRVAMTQMRGGITHKLGELRDQLLQITSLLELELDFSEEDVEFADRTQLHHLLLVLDDEINRLCSSFAAGNSIKNGIPVAIIGAPNVGKSTLLNRLLHDDRAIVSDIQGTTRDLIEDTINLGGFLFRFIDTAGIRHTDDTIEQMGIERSRKAAEQAQVIILMRDENTDFPQINSSKNNSLVINVINKSNEFQALTGLGVDKLEQQLIDFATSLASSQDDVLITNLRHKQALELAHHDVQRATSSLQSGLTGDIISEDLRQCLSHLSDIIGTQITSDEVLANIFKNFCIGK